jgi:tRNA pseudouridine38-40 synthase
MYYYRATIQYDGTGYSGFQWQRETPTIQDELNRALQKLLAGRVTVAGASRTDAGVHAVGQIIRITCEAPVDCSALLTSLNLTLPPQIHCLDLVPSTMEFNPNTGSVSKEYRYLFTNQARVEAEDRRFISNLANPLDFPAMMVCSRRILGAHDFQNFCSTGSNVKTTIREVTVCQLTELDPRTLFSNRDLFRVPAELERCYQLQIEANGFIKQMIRHLVSALWLVGSARMTESEFCQLLDGPRRDKQLWKPAPARGLYLFRITYPEPQDFSCAPGSRAP